MSKKRKEEAAFGSSDGLTDALIAEATQLWGGRFYTGQEAYDLVMGLPLLAFSLRVFFRTKVFPLGRITGLVGRPGSLKSSLAVEMLRWHRYCGGRGFILGTESKDSPRLRSSILNYDNEACYFTECGQLEDWQSATTKIVLAAHMAMEKHNLNYPVQITVDSICGAAARSTAEDVLTDGFASAAYGTDAKLINAHLKVIHGMLVGRPISLVYTNHMKQAMNAGYGNVTTAPGGEGPRFFQTYQINMERRGKDLVWKMGKKARRVRLTFFKNGLGIDKDSMEVEMAFWHDYSTGKAIQRTVWDWDKASAEMLLHLHDLKDDARLRDAVRERCHIRKRTRGGMGTCYWSRTLGVSEEDALPPALFARILESNTEVVSSLESILGVDEYKVYPPAAEYLATYGPPVLPTLDDPDPSDGNAEEVDDAFGSDLTETA